MDISQMPVVEKRSWRGRTRTSRGLESGHARQLSLRQERRRRKVGLEDFEDAKEEERVKGLGNESREEVDKEWMMKKKTRNKGEVNWKKGDKLSLIKENPTGPRAVSGILENQVDLFALQFSFPELLQISVKTIAFFAFSIHRKKATLREAFKKNMGLFGNFPQTSDPPTPPFWERLVQNEIFWVIL